MDVQNRNSVYYDIGPNIYTLFFELSILLIKYTFILNINFLLYGFDAGIQIFFILKVYFC